MSVQLKKHDRKYTEVMSSLLSDPLIQNALSLNWQQVSIYGTRDYIDFILGEERMGNQLSRVIFNENDEFVGVTTLKHLQNKNRIAHIGTWIGSKYWGKGYNEQSKEQILWIAFVQLKLELVFAGATTSNKRSVMAQNKLPYMIHDVGDQFPEHLELIEQETGEPCILNVVRKEDFLSYMSNKKVIQ